MGFDAIVFDDDFKFSKELHIDNAVHELLFRKLVTEETYPYLGKLKNDKEDLIFMPEDLPALMDDIVKLEAYLAEESPMSPEVKAKCTGFVGKLKDMCSFAMEQEKSLDFIAGE
jgi:hypothetical protein